MLKVSVKEENGSDVAITVRLYGPNTEYVIDRKRELLVSHLLILIIYFLKIRLYRAKDICRSKKLCYLFKNGQLEFT